MDTLYFSFWKELKITIYIITEKHFTTETLETLSSNLQPLMDDINETKLVITRRHRRHPIIIIVYRTSFRVALIIYNIIFFNF